MKFAHKIASCAIFFIIAVVVYIYEIKLPVVAAQGLITFFSIFFAFYISSIAIIFGSSYSRYLYKLIYDKEQVRAIHVLRSYFLASGYCSLISTSSIIVFVILAEVDNQGYVSMNIESLVFHVSNISINLNLFILPCIFGIALVNIFYMALFLHFISNSLIEEARININSNNSGGDKP